jgi:hypothetical protein
MRPRSWTDSEMTALHMMQISRVMQGTLGAVEPAVMQPRLS